MVEAGSDMSPGPARPRRGGAGPGPAILTEEQLMSLDQAPHVATSETIRQPILSLVHGREGPAAVVEVRGPLDMDTVHLLVDVVDSVMAGQPPPVLVLDLGQVNFFCAAGITALLTARRRAASDGCALLVRNPSRITRTVLGIAGLADEFAIDHVREPRLPLHGGRWRLRRVSVGADGVRDGDPSQDQGGGEAGHQRGRERQGWCRGGEDEQCDQPGR
ncbi:hypothetical protein DLE60_28815 [Micromonospora globispora]|uniref:STAS domain-containing protein n=1 Tax=Micromonospora globispora TaxID=1450148 RepID=A0A317JXI3_9ACTN|nr:hypothetical protein DLJ46_22800 [Micromonospora globispora]PWU55075.1 hypothetical protein DLE60_28815 [Micromonospora globispora]